MKVDGLFFRRNFDALHPFKFFYAALDLLCLGRLIAKAIDEGFELLDLLPLIAIGRLELCHALLPLRQVLLVIPAIELHALVPDLDRLAYGDVKEIPVVRNEYKGMRIGGEVVLQPVPRFQIEMIGGFVEQQQVGLLQQQLG